MVLPKRPFQFVDGDEDSGFRTGSGRPGQESKRFRNAIRDVIGKLSVDDFVAKMEPYLRDVVRDEVERTVRRVLLSSSRFSFNDQNRTSGKQGLMLHFVNKLPSTIFTAGRIEADDGSPIRIVLMNANTKTVVTSGPLASLKIEILALDADFGSDEHENWSEAEFKANIIREREGRRPLVTGELTVTLQDGVGQVGDIVFTDNSSWQRSRKFRLGARPVQKVSDEIRIREGRSEAFMVKDHRGELYRKHHPPQLQDEIWRLEKIAKGGAFHKRLASNGVESVQDFLQLYMINPPMLRNVLGCGISNRIWNTIIEHAVTCVLDESKLYLYYDPNQTAGLLFNSIYKVVGATFDGHNYEALHKITPAQKVLVESLKRQAFKNINLFIQVDAGAIFGVLRSLTNLQAEPFYGQNQTPQQLEFPVARQGPSEMQMDFNNSSTSTSYGYEAESSSQIEVSVAQNNNNNHHHQAEAFPQMFRNSFKFTDFFPLPTENSWSPNGWPVATNNQLSVEDMSEVQTSAWSPGNSFFFSSSNEGELGIFSSNPNFGVHMSRRIRKPKASWCKLRAALKMGSVMRDVTAKKAVPSLLYVKY